MNHGIQQVNGEGLYGQPIAALMRGFEFEEAINCLFIETKYNGMQQQNFSWPGRV